MPLFRKSVEIQAAVEQVFAFHMDPANIERVAPPDSKTKVLSSSEVPLRPGSRVVVRSIQMGMPVTLEAEITAIEENRMFEDRQVLGPFKSWRHRHLFEAVPGGTRLTDEVEFEAPAGLPGRPLAHRVIQSYLEKTFAYRQEATRRLLEQEGAAEVSDATGSEPGRP